MLVVESLGVKKSTVSEIGQEKEAHILAHTCTCSLARGT